MALKGSGVRRERADEIVRQIAQRAQEVNDNSEFAYNVTKIAVFGSYINSDKDKLGDLDIAADIVPRYEGEEQLQAIRATHKKRGPAGAAFLDQLCFGYCEVERYLKSRRNCMSLHEFEELEKLNTVYRLIYEMPHDSASPQ